MPQGTQSILTKIPLFKDLPTEALDRLSAVCRQKSFKKGVRIYSEGDTAHVTWLVESGRMTITKLAFDGKPLTIELIRPGEIFGCVACSDSGFYPCEATASVDSTVISIPTPDFLALIEKHPRFARKVYMEMGERVREAQNMRTLGLETVSKRLAGVLLWLRGKFGDVLPFTRQSIAEMANTTPESTIRTLIQFRKDGLIRTAWKKITLVKPEGLKALLEQG